MQQHCAAWLAGPDSNSGGGGKTHSLGGTSTQLLKDVAPGLSVV